MIRKCITSFLVVAFLSFVVTPGSVSAAEGSVGSIDVGPSRSQVAVVAGGIIVVGLLVAGIVYLANKHSSSPAEQPQEQKPGTPQSLHFQKSDEQPVTQAGQIAVLRW